MKLLFLVMLEGNTLPVLAPSFSFLFLDYPCLIILYGEESSLEIIFF